MSGPRPAYPYPCPRCGGPKPAVVECPASRTRFVMCLGCRLRGPRHHRREDAVGAWDRAAEASALRAAARAARAVRFIYSNLRGDPAFVEAVMSGHVCHSATAEPYGVRGQVMRVRIGGQWTAVNVRAFVDMVLVQRWPQLAELTDPEALVHAVLRDNGHRARVIEDRKPTGENVGLWHRAGPVVGLRLGEARQAEEAD